MKKFAALLLCAASLSIIGCGGKADLKKTFFLRSLTLSTVFPASSSPRATSKFPVFPKPR